MAVGRRDRYAPESVADAGERAVVVGGSLAGLCAARVLADGFEEGGPVSGIQRDVYG